MNAQPSDQLLVLRRRVGGVLDSRGPTLTLLFDDAPPSSARTVPAAPGWQPRSELELATQQLRAVELFNRACRVRERAGAAVARSREMQMDAARSLEVLRHQHDAVIGRAHEQLQASGGILRCVAERRAVLAQRDDWLRRKVARALEDQEVWVVAATDNGADAVGVVVAEQPDLVLVDDALAMLTGREVIRAVRHFSPGTVVTAKADHGGRVDLLLDAGATVVFTRQTAPADVALSLLELVGAA